MPLRHKLELRSSNVQTDEIFEAAMASHEEFEKQKLEWILWIHQEKFQAVSC